jgi:hypothetical protein
MAEDLLEDVFSLKSNLQDFDPRVTALARPSSNCMSELETRPHVTEGVPREESRKYPTGIQIWS